MRTANSVNFCEKLIAELNLCARCEHQEESGRGTFVSLARKDYLTLFEKPMKRCTQHLNWRVQWYIQALDVEGLVYRLIISRVFRYVESCECHRKFFLPAILETLMCPLAKEFEVLIARA